MNIKRAILTGALTWVIIFFEVSILMFGLKFEGLVYYIAHYILLIPIMILCSKIYYKKKDKSNGFLVGFLFFVVGTILDLIITAPLFTGYKEFYSNIYLWIGFAEGILIVGIYDLMRRKL